MREVCTRIAVVVQHGHCSRGQQLAGDERHVRERQSQAAHDFVVQLVEALRR